MLGERRCLLLAAPRLIAKIFLNVDATFDQFLSSFLHRLIQINASSIKLAASNKL